MATENKLLAVSRVAAEDLSNDQYRIVVETSSGVRRPNTITDVPFGVLQNKPASGEEASILPIGCGGISKIEASAALAIGVRVGIEYVSATDAGKAQVAVDTQYPVGIITASAADAEDDLASVILVNQTIIQDNSVLANAIADPGDGNAIPVTASGSIAITTAAAETNTMAIPTFVGQQISLIVDVYAVGDRVITVASAINQTGNNTITLGAAADMIVLTAMQVGGVLVWRVTANDGAALSTV